MDQLRLDCLEAHNEYRARHGVPPLILNPDIDAVAQKWSEYLAESDKFEHSTGSGYGENLAGAYGEPLPDGRQAVANLYDEIKDYNFNNHGFSLETGHFTQVVWLASKELGIGAARNSKGMWVMTFNYAPSGNMMGEFPKNVFREGEGPHAAENPNHENDYQPDNRSGAADNPQPVDQQQNDAQQSNGESNGEYNPEPNTQSDIKCNTDDVEQESDKESHSEEKDIALEEKPDDSEQKKKSCCTIL